MLESIPLSLPPEIGEIAERVLGHGLTSGTMRLQRPVVAHKPDPRSLLPDPPGGPWLTTEEFAARSGLTVHAVSARARRGKPRSVEVRDSSGRKRYLVAEDELERIEQPLPIDASLYLTPSEFGERVGLTAVSVNARIRRGSIKAIRSNRRVRRSNWLIPETEVERFIELQRRTAETAANIIAFTGCVDPSWRQPQPVTQLIA
jgi:hypothetical protein